MNCSKLSEPPVKRTIYLNVMYSLMILLSALCVGVLVASEDVGNEQYYPRYQVCKLSDNSSTLPESTDAVCRYFVNATYDHHADPSFVPIDAEQELADTQQTMFQIAAWTLGINSILFAHTLMKHLLPDGGSTLLVQLHQSGGVVISVVNICLFAAFVGWIDSVVGVDNADNLKYNEYFKNINIDTAAIMGIVFSGCDLVFQLYLLVPHLLNKSEDPNVQCWR